MKRFTFCFALVLCGTVGCVSSVTSTGSKIRLVSESQKESCQYLGIVTAHAGFGWSSAHNTEGVLNELRNKVAKLGGNAMFLHDTDTAGMFSQQVAGSGEALVCSTWSAPENSTSITRTGEGNIESPSKADQTRGEGIQQCIDVCVKNTSRSPEVCFDACVD